MTPPARSRNTSCVPLKEQAVLPRPLGLRTGTPYLGDPDSWEWGVWPQKHLVPTKIRSKALLHARVGCGCDSSLGPCHR